MIPQALASSNRSQPIIILLATLIFPAISTAAELVHNPVRGGDFPDPSIIRLGTNYWATATSSEWTPHFPLMRSSDLVNWTTVGNVFPEKPAWAANNFWAPELVELNNRFFVYYVARQKSGPLTVAVASADRPEGPYADHGPLVAQADGSIDAATARDENGKLHMLWKEDGNSRGLPTIIWAQPLKESGTELTGARVELLRNDAAWEGAVVEGPFIVRRGKYFYLFYSGNGCCGPNCNYALGVARAEKLLGPYEKNPANPILISNDTWKCPGHGSIVETPDRRYFLLYHAYSTAAAQLLGRQAMLDEITFDQDEWPRAAEGTPSVRFNSPFKTEDQQSEFHFTDNFDSETLNPEWTWPVFDKNPASIANGALVLKSTSTNFVGAILARIMPTTNVTAQITIHATTNSTGGLALLSDRNNGLGLAIHNNALFGWRRSNSRESVFWESPISSGNRIHLRLQTADAQTVSFSYSGDGESWTNVPASSINSRRYQRIALTAGGPGQARFDNVRIDITGPRP